MNGSVLLAEDAISELILNGGYTKLELAERLKTTPADIDELLSWRDEKIVSQFLSKKLEQLYGQMCFISCQS